MRKLVALSSLLLVPFCCAHAQDQEHKLIDRIMKPDMKLENDAQNKKFIADKTSVNKKAQVNTFYVQQRPDTKQYGGARQYSSGQFSTGEFQQRDHAAVRQLSNKKADDWTFFAASKTAETRAVHDQNKTQLSRSYAGNRPYLEQGKSQKSLNRKNRPMTIDQVRDLLNKSK